MALEDKCKLCGAQYENGYGYNETTDELFKICEKCGATEIDPWLKGNRMCEEIIIKETTKGIELTDVNGATIVISNHTEAVKLARDLLDVSIEVID